MGAAKLQQLILAAALALPGCYSHTLKDAPRPTFQETKKGKDWNEYIDKLEAKYNAGKYEPGRDKTYERESFAGKQQLFKPYIDWLNELTGKALEARQLHIIEDNRFPAFLGNGIVGLFGPDAIFWYGDIYVRDSHVSFTSIAHEYGHFADAHLDNSDYITCRRARVRMEAVAEAFEHYTGLELIKQGNNYVGKKSLFEAPAELDKIKTLDDLVESGDRYTAARNVAAVLMNSFHEMGKVWHFLACNDQQDVYKKVEDICKADPLPEALKKGYEKLHAERDKILRARQQADVAKK